MCQDRLYTLYCFEKNYLLSTSPIVVSNQQMLSSQGVSNMYSNEPNCTVS